MTMTLSMRRMALAVAIACASAARTAFAADGWRPLFAPDYSDGVHDPDVWHVDADGNLTAEKDVAYWTKDEYSRFELECEYNLDPAGNSGVVIYCSDTENWIPNSVEIQLIDNEAPKWKGLNPRQANLAFFGHQAPSSNPARPAGEWNSFRLKADGPRLEVTLNGVLVNVCDLSQWTDARRLPDGSEIPPWLSRPWSELATTGRIGFQGRHAGARVRFRNIRIRPLPATRRIRRLMSFNIRMGCGHDDPFRLPKGSLGHLPQCARVIGRCLPDYCGLQEVDRFSDRAGGMDQTAELAKLCGMEGSWVEKIPQYGISALYRERPFRVSKVLMKGRQHTRALMISEFPDCVIANTHYPLSEETCNAAAETTLAALGDFAKDRPVFLMGDFNSLPDSEAVRILRREFVPISDPTVFTFPAKGPDRTIDYIFVDKAHVGAFKVLSRKVLAAPEATDHAALLVELEPLASGSSAVTFTGENAEVVIDAKAPPAVRFAMSEATNFLSRTFGRAIPVVNEPTEGKVSLVLGENAWSKAAGIGLEGLKRDTFVIRTAGSRVHVVGRDDPRADPLTYADTEGFERATLFGVYEFLERFAGCRFYFPGELGEVVPRRDSFEVAETDLVSSPCCPVRKYYNHAADGELYEGAPPLSKRLHWYRVRGATMQIPCCHGTLRFKLLDRYGSSHPEYFALRSDGTRCVGYDGTSSSRNGHLCYSSGVRDIIVDECAKRLRAGAEFVDIMPNDSYPECRCAQCQAAYRKDDRSNYASDLIWGYTVYVANRLKELGVKGNVTQMAYCPYRRMPDFDIPDNVYVMIAVGGPWVTPNASAVKHEYEEIRRWKGKLANPVWIWAYPHKYGPTLIAGVPDVGPRAWAKYYKGIAADTIGTFAESETDHWIYHYLNYYVFGKVMWDPTVDADAVLDEHYRLMFGPAAAEMKAFYELLEDKWVKEVAGNIVETNRGPVSKPPSEHDLWTRVYGSETVDALRGCLDRAAARVEPGSIEARRVAFFRREYFEGLDAGRAAYGKKFRAVEALRWQAGKGETVSLVPFGLKKGKAQADPVRTTVSAKRTDDALVFVFDCEEPRMDDMAVTERSHDDADMWRDSGIELYLNPSCDRMTCYHLIVNAAGGLSDYRSVKSGGGFAEGTIGWESGAKTSVARRTDGYTVTVTVPLAPLGDVPDSFPVEVCRSRVTKSGKGYGLYHWSPYSRFWDEVRAFGTICLPRP